MNKQLKFALIITLCLLAVLSAAVFAACDDNPQPQPPLQVTVTYDKNDPSATGAMSAQTCVSGQKTKLAANAFFSGGGLSFGGWNTQADGQGVFYSDQAEAEFTSDITLYAQWRVTYTEKIYAEQYDSVSGKYVYNVVSERAVDSAFLGNSVTVGSVYNQPHYFLDVYHQDSVTEISNLQNGDVLSAYYSLESILISYSDDNTSVKVRFGESYEIRTPEQQGDSERKTVTYSTDSAGNGREYAFGQTVTVDEAALSAGNITLYPITAEIFADLDGSGDTVQIRTDILGLGSAKLIKGGKAYSGFVNVTEGLITFDVTVEGEVLRGKLLNDGKFIYRNEEEAGMYLMYNPLYPQDGLYAYLTLNLDGYGTGALAYPLADGTDRIASYFVSYSAVENGEYNMEYYLPEAPEKVYEDNFKIVRGKVDGAEDVEGVDIVGYFMVRGSEYGGFPLLYNWQINSEYVLSLDGYGGGVYYRLSDDDILSQVTLSYYASNNEQEYVIRTEDANHQLNGALFILLDRQDPTTGEYYTFFLLKRGEAGTYAQTGGTTYPSLYLDGYGMAMYYSSENDDGSLGSYTIETASSGYEVMINFVGDNAGTLRVGINSQNGSFTVLDNNFRVNADGVLIEYLGNASVIVVPESVDGITVTSVADETFNNKYVTSVSLPSTIVSIGARAFQNDRILRTVYIAAATPPAIGENAFNWLRSDFLVIVPDGCEQTYRQANGWTAYAAYITSNGELADKPEFEIRDGELVSYNAKQTSSVSVVIPDGVTSVANGVFANREYIVSVDLNNVTVIGDNAFDGCVNLASVTFNPDTVSIGEYAFFNCLKLTQVNLGNVQTVGEYAFFRCYALAKVVIGSRVQSIGTFAFAMCSVEVDESESTTVQHDLIVQMAPSAAPQMGLNVFGGSKPRIYVPSYEVGLLYANSPSWALYAGSLRVKTNQTQTLYSMSNVGSTLVLSDNALFDSSRSGLYKWDGSKLTIAWFDRSGFEGTTSLSVVVQSGALDEQTGLIRGFSLYDNTPLVFVTENSQVSYSCGDETLIITFGSDSALFNGENVALQIVNYRAQFTYDGYVYTLDLQTDSTFTYDKTVVRKTVTYTAQDGSTVTVTYGNSVTANGTLKNVDGEERTQTGWLLTRESDGSYSWIILWREKSYKAVALFDNENNTFTYVASLYCVRDNVPYRNDSGYVTVTSYVDGRVDLSIVFVTANGNLQCNVQNAQVAEDGQNVYLVTVDITVDQLDENGDKIGEMPSAFNGDYRVELNSANHTSVLTKLS